VPSLVLGETHSDFTTMLPHQITLYSVDLTPEALADADLVLLLVHHRVFDLPSIVNGAKLVYDTRNCTKDIVPRPDHLHVL